MEDSNKFILFCDESCHLQFDSSDVMCIGGIVVPALKFEAYKNDIKAIKHKYGIYQEIKWNTIGASRIDMYKDLIDYFFASDMSFRSILIKNKGNIAAKTLNRDEYNSFYYSLVEKLIRFSVNHNGGKNNDFKVYLDLKDSNGTAKLNAVKAILTKELDSGNKVSHLQNIRSHESVFIQIADIFIGAITYRARGLNKSVAKCHIVEQIEQLSGYNLSEGTEPGDSKFSIYDFQPKRRNG